MKAPDPLRLVGARELDLPAPVRPAHDRPPRGLSDLQRLALILRWKASYHRCHH